MKHKGIILLLPLVAACAEPLPQRVDFPRYAFRSSETQEIVSVERTDTATVFSMKSFFKPGWWIRMAEDTHLCADGRTYALKGTEGIVPGEELTMGEDGTAEYRLFFEPVPEEVKEVDFIEAEDNPDGFRFYGIDLTGRTPKRRPVREPVLERLPEVVLESGESCLEIIPDRTARFEEGDVHVYVSQAFLDNMKQYLPEWGADGIGRVRFPVYGMATVRLWIPGSVQAWPVPFVRARAGETVRVRIDLSARSFTRTRFGLDEPEAPPVRFDGYYAGLAHMEEKLADTKGFWSPRDVDAVVDMAVDARTYSDSVRSFYRQDLARLDTMGLGPAEKEYAALNLKATVLNYLGSAWNAQIIRHQRQGGTTEYHPWHFTREDLAWLRDLDLDSPQTAYSVHFNDFLSTVPVLADAASADTAGLVHDYVRFTSRCKLVTMGVSLPDGAEEFTYPFFADLLRDLGNRHGQLPPSVQEVPDVPNEELLDAILKKHEGRVVVVDFWATWCGPCKLGIQALAPLKKTDYADVDFVYLTGPTSPPETWREMIPDIEGYHYYLSEEPLRYLMDSLGSDGYPTYLVVDKKRGRGSSLVGYNEEKLKNLIDKALR